MAVRTKQLAVASSSPQGAEHVIYTAPAGETVIVKDVHVASAGVDVSRAVVFMNSGPRRIALMDRALSPVDFIALTVWVVMNPGDTIGVFAQAGTFNTWVSGTELEGQAD